MQAQEVREVVVQQGQTLNQIWDHIGISKDEQKTGREELGNSIETVYSTLETSEEKTKTRLQAAIDINKKNVQMLYKQLDLETNEVDTIFKKNAGVVTKAAT